MLCALPPGEIPTYKQTSENPRGEQLLPLVRLPRILLKHRVGLFFWHNCFREVLLNPFMVMVYLPFMHSCLLNLSLVNKLFKKKILFKITHTLNSRTAVCLLMLWKGTSQVLGVGTGQTAWSALAALTSPAGCPHTLPSKRCSSDANWLTELLWAGAYGRGGRRGCG